MSTCTDIKHQLAVASRVLANEKVVDAFGHISHRHPDKPDRFLLSCSRSPGLVTPDDIMEHTLEGDPVDSKGEQKPFLERFIHGAVYEARPDVQAVVHNHAYDIIPFSISKTPIRPAIHVAATIGKNIPIWDIRDKFHDTDLLVRNMDHGRELVRFMGDAKVALMRGHGAVVCGSDIIEAVLNSLYLMVNAQIILKAKALGDDIVYLSDGEIELGSKTHIGTPPAKRAWEYLVSRIETDF